ncbi:hypothetical protein [Desulfosporosinus sp. FKA]|uniref:phage adaptor protein n=1 Tax=Desulfosporosinus sp. FKA TaxID=1969834 RepID=UPI000B499D5B|nr:hypothetical protein [Desulfosporosinus sp. FKA]
MAITITDLITEFRTQIRDNGTTQALTDQEVTQFITDGFRTYSKYRPRKRPTTISVKAGQSTYSLPDDWITQEEDSFEAAINPSPAITPMQAWTLSPFTLLSAARLIAKPLAAYEQDVQYDFYPSDLQLIIVPVPQMSYDLAFNYYAYHTSDSIGCTVPYLDIDNALLPGVVKALRSIATDYSVKLQHYKMGNNIEIDDKTVAKNLQSRADELEKQFVRDIIKRPSGMAG